MKKYNTSYRLKQIMNERGLKQTDILDLCKPYCEIYGVKLAKNDLSQYISGKVQPKQDKLSILGLALGVNEVWLMGYDVPEGKNELYGNLNTDDKANTSNPLLQIYNNLNNEGQARLMQYAEELIEIDKYKKCDTISEDIG